MLALQLLCLYVLLYTVFIVEIKTGVMLNNIGPTVLMSAKALLIMLNVLRLHTLLKSFCA